MANYQGQDAIAELGAVSSQGAPPPSAGSGASRQPESPGAVSRALPQDSVEISLAARKAAAQPPAQGKAPDGDPVNVPDGDADDLRFNYNTQTHTLQTQVVDTKSGKPVMEIPSDEQIRLQESLQKIFKSRGRGGSEKVKLLGDSAGV